MKVRHRNRGRRAYSPVVRSLHRSQVQIRCPYCHAQRRVWYDRIPADAAPYEAARLLQCPETRCGVTLWAYITPEWRDYAELWRPWQRVLDQRWTPSEGPEPKPPADDPPAPITPKLAERTMKARHAYYMLSTRRELAAVILRTDTQPDPSIWEGGTVEVADLYLFVPEDPDDLDALLDSQPQVKALHEASPLTPGEPIELQGVIRGLDTDCWWPLRDRTVSLDHQALEDAAPDTDTDTDTDTDDNTWDGWPVIEEQANDAAVIEEPAEASPLPAEPEPDLEPAVEVEARTFDATAQRWMREHGLGIEAMLAPTRVPEVG